MERECWESKERKKQQKKVLAGPHNRSVSARLFGNLPLYVMAITNFSLKKEKPISNPTPSCSLEFIFILVEIMWNIAKQIKFIRIGSRKTGHFLLELINSRDKNLG